MMTLKKHKTNLSCKGCGAPIEGATCGYCGKDNYVVFVSPKLMVLLKKNRCYIDTPPNLYGYADQFMGYYIVPDHELKGYQFETNSEFMRDVLDEEIKEYNSRMNSIRTTHNKVITMLTSTGLITSTGYLDLRELKDAMENYGGRSSIG